MNSYLKAINLIEQLLNEKSEVEVSFNADDADDFIKASVAQGTHTTQTKSKSKKSKKDKLNQTKKETDEEELDDSDLEDDDGSKQEDDDSDAEDEKDYKVNLVDAVDFEKLIPLLNKFRAAHSFSDGKINDELKTYFKRLSDSEKKALHVFIKALIQITLVDVKGKAAYTPEDLGISIIKKSSTRSEKDSSKKLKDKLKDEYDDSEDEKIRDKLQSKTNSKDEDFNSPIKIGEVKQNKEDIFKLLKSI